MTTRAKNNIGKPITKMNLHTQLTKCDDHEPTTLTQALKDHKWRRSMSKEYDALVKNGTWALFHRITVKIWLAINGFLELNANLMVLLTGSRLDWLQKASTNVLE